MNPPSTGVSRNSTLSELNKTTLQSGINMLRITSLAVTGLALLFCNCDSTAEVKPKVVSELHGIQSIRLSWRSERTKPIFVRNDQELVKSMPNRIDFEVVRKQIDFGKQQLLIFAWEGDAQDRIKIKSDGTKIEFVHWVHKRQRSSSALQTICC